MINFDDFKKVEMRIGKILEAEVVPETDKLMKLVVDFGEEGQKQVISGIKGYISVEELVGKKRIFVTNLEPRVIKGLESQAMILACGGGELPLALLESTKDLENGTKVN